MSEQITGEVYALAMKIANPKPVTHGRNQWGQLTGPLWMPAKDRVFARNPTRADYQRARVEGYLGEEQT